jgi:hypothetical protein
MPEQHIPIWLDAKVDQRLAQMQEAMPIPVMAAATGAHVIMVTLTEPDEDATPEQIQQWNLTCDNCGKVDPVLHTGHMERRVDGVLVVITMGACASCLSAT